jgi:hypothetical protein
MKDGSAFKLVAVEECAAGKGNLGLAVAMFEKPGELPLAETVTTGTRYRAHRDHCPGGKARAAGGAFSGGERRKARPGC